MKKVFYLCVEAFSLGRRSFARGEEIAAMNVPIGFSNKFRRIERDCFEAHNQTWFRHTPGEPMPCDGGALVEVLIDGATGADIADKFSWDDCGPVSIIGWRYAEQAGAGAQIHVTVDAETVTGQAAGSRSHDNDDMKQADIAAVTDHGHLSPGQRKHIDAMEAKQAAKESDAAEREQANLAERGKALESAAQAMDSVRDVHGHRLGWMV